MAWAVQVNRAYLVHIRSYIQFLENFRKLRPAISGEHGAMRSVISTLWIRLKSADGPEYAPLNTGAIITRANSENGALPTRESEEGEDEVDPGQ